MNNKIIPVVIITALVVGAGAFYGGMQYGQSKNSSSFARGDFADLGNLSEEEREQRMEEMQANMSANLGAGFRGTRAGGGGLNMAAGEIIESDDKSITVKMADGGSRIVFLSEDTSIVKQAEGSQGDLIVGEQVVVSGEESSEGVYTATMIQLRNNGFVPPAD